MVRAPRSGPERCNWAAQSHQPRIDETTGRLPHFHHPTPPHPRRKIGVGSFGSAYLCTERATHTPVVIKRVSTTDMTESEKRTAKREASLLQALHHPAILRHVTSFETDAELCLVTQYCDRGDLSKMVEARQGALLPEPVVLMYFTQLCAAMLYLHKRKVGRGRGWRPRRARP